MLQLRWRWHGWSVLRGLYILVVVLGILDYQTMQCTVHCYQIRFSEHTQGIQLQVLYRLFQRISVRPLQAKKHLPGEMHDAPSSFPPSVCLHVPNSNTQTRNALTSASTTSSQLHNFLSTALKSALSLVPLVPALLRAVTFRRAVDPQ
jgi:hypothetical protein